MKDYYQILGIKPDASTDEIKSAYRKIAIRSHPDKHKADEGLFKEASEAYEVLKNEEKRQIYDEKRIPKESGRKSRVRRGTDLKIQIAVKMEDLVKSKTKIIETMRKGRCHTCSGTGSPGGLILCQKCGGSGIEAISAIVGPKSHCPACNGYGSIPGIARCLKCGGTGIMPEKLRKGINLNPLTVGRIVLKGDGNYCTAGEPGDMVVEINVETDPVYTMQGLNLRRTLAVSPAQAVLGDEIFIGVFGRMVSIKFPPGTQHGYLIEKKGEGLSYGSRKGNLSVRIRIEVPEPYLDPVYKDGRLRKLYEQILKIEKGEIWQKTSKL